MSKTGRQRYSSEQIIKKPLDADALLSSGKDLGTVLQSLQISEGTVGAVASSVRMHEERQASQGA